MSYILCNGVTGWAADTGLNLATMLQDQWLYYPAVVHYDQRLTNMNLIYIVVYCDERLTNTYTNIL
jgi:hypothetical protein